MIKINTDWFRNFVGDDTLVPVRIDNYSSNNSCSESNNQNNDGVSIENDQEDSGLDADGRAQECDVMEMTLSGWIMRCQQYEQHKQQPQTCCGPEKKTIQSERNEDSTANHPNQTTKFYLKDWHLVKFLSDKTNYVSNQQDLNVSHEGHNVRRLGHLGLDGDDVTLFHHRFFFTSVCFGFFISYRISRFT